MNLGRYTQFEGICRKKKIHLLCNLILTDLIVYSFSLLSRKKKFVKCSVLESDHFCIEALKSASVTFLKGGLVTGRRSRSQVGCNGKPEEACNEKVLLSNAVPGRWC